MTALNQGNISQVMVLYDETGYYRITGRVDDVIIVSGHNLGTAPIEDASTYNIRCRICNCRFHDIKGNALYGFVFLKELGKETKKI